MRILPSILMALLVVHFVDANKKMSKEEKVKRAKDRMAKINNHPRNHGKFKAGFNERFVLMDEELQKRLSGARLPKGMPPKPAGYGSKNSTESGAGNAENATVPNRGKRQTTTCTTTYEFDARKQWPGCAPIINFVQDQSTCGSCWAVATASTFTDRYCIQRAKKGLTTNANDATRHASAADIMTCSDGKAVPPDGCQGGYHDLAWQWTKTSGVQSGTNYTWNSGCKPYPFPPIGTEEYVSPSCTTGCTKSGWFLTPKKKATWASSLAWPGEDGIMDEIRANGSVVAFMLVYQDFIENYPETIYEHFFDDGSEGGGHAVRLIGWGTTSCSNGLVWPFWLGVNSWGTGWGDGGFFKITRGSNECEIESHIAFGTPNPDM